MSGKICSIGVAFVVGVSVAACSAGVQRTSVPSAAQTVAPTLTQAPTPTPTHAPTPTPAPTIPPLRSGNSAAGTYRIEQLDPEVHLTLPDGWELYFNDAGGAYLNTGGGELLVGRPKEVIVPDENEHQPAPEDLMAWLVEHPSLNVTDPTPVDISGHDASYVEIDTTHKVDVFYDPLGNFHVGPGTGVRFYVIPLDGPDILVALLKDEFGQFDTALEAGVPIVESIEILE